MDKYNQIWVAKLFNKPRWAITIGQVTFYSVPYLDVNHAWERHENKHKEQWKREGLIKFAVKYLWYQIRYGYQNNPFEIEAREAEKVCR